MTGSDSSLGGEWVALKAPFLSTCRVYYNHQGRSRYVHVFLPPTYDGTKTFPIWIHLHGVFWATMGGATEQAGRPVNSTDIIPYWDQAVARLGNESIIAYPQAWGDAGRGDPSEGQGSKFRQFWSVPFWQCSVGICSDPAADDVGFIEAVVADLPDRLPLAGDQLYLSGESAGGMLVNAVLCESEPVAAAVAAAADMLGGLGADYAASRGCAPGGGDAPALPYLKLHGTEDPSIPFDQVPGKEVLVDGVKFLGAAGAAAARAAANGCDAEDAGPSAAEAGGALQCRDLCAHAGDGSPTVKVCGITGVGHDTDHPHPGFVFEQAWAFFRAHGGEKALAQAEDARAARSAKRAAAASVSAAIGGDGHPEFGGHHPDYSHGSGHKLSAAAAGAVGGVLGALALAALVTAACGAAAAWRRRARGAAAERRAGKLPAPIKPGGGGRPDIVIIASGESSPVKGERD
ncbi:MAG: hypothetical protein J3K34DRAFT_520610 [Monoraphidium minutum]|nr:MAG: hypothetical protein J3K34DRAFT_520610 [Monoraphidium minutum]